MLEWKNTTPPDTSARKYRGLFGSERSNGVPQRSGVYGEAPHPGAQHLGNDWKGYPVGLWSQGQGRNAAKRTLDADGADLASAPAPHRAQPGGVPVRKGDRIGPPFNRGPGAESEGCPER